jgi:hypothetical protein
MSTTTNINAGTISTIDPGSIQNQMIYTCNTPYVAGGGYTYPYSISINTTGINTVGGGAGGTGGYYTVNTNFSYPAINTNQIYTNQTYTTMDTGWYEQFNNISVKVGDETKTFNKQEITKVLEQYVELLQLCDEFPQVKHIKDKLDVIVKLHTNPDNDVT